MNEFEDRLAANGGEGLYSESTSTFQVNLGLRCNLSCTHCHVKASPTRTEEMDWPTMELVMVAAEKAGCRFFDLTGGSPELSDGFSTLVPQPASIAAQVTAAIRAALLKNLLTTVLI